MLEQPFDTLTRSAAAASARRSLLGAGGAGLATALAGSFAATAKKKNKAKKKAKKKCNQQIASCEEFVEEFCQDNTVDPADEAECIAQISPCCAQCNVEFGVSCVLDFIL